MMSSRVVDAGWCRRAHRGLLSILAVVTAPAFTPLRSHALLSAQTLRDFTALRALGGESRLELRLDLVEGAWRVGRADRGILYAVNFTHAPARFTPVARLDDMRSLHLGLRGESHAGLRLKPPGRLVQEGVVRLSPEVEWNLNVRLGSSEADLDLGGIAFGQLTLDAAASRTTIRFPDVNRVLCRRATFTVGAGELVLEGLGNSGCRGLEVDGRLGRLVLDFSGALPGDVHGTLDLDVGTLVLRFPPGVGVRIATDRILSRFKADGFDRRGDAYVTPGYDGARRKVDLRLASTLGSVSVEWLER